MVGMLKEMLKQLKIFITDLIEIEISYINTNHPDFQIGNIENQTRNKQVVDIYKNKLDTKNKEQVECDIVKQLLIQYFQIVLKNISDTVPKSIMHFLVNKSKSILYSELIGKFYKEYFLFKKQNDILKKGNEAYFLLSTLQNEIIKFFEK
jgi:hypothetical protein